MFFLCHKNEVLVIHKLLILKINESYFLDIPLPTPTPPPFSDPPRKCSPKTTQQSAKKTTQPRTLVLLDGPVT